MLWKYSVVKRFENKVYIRSGHITWYPLVSLKLSALYNRLHSGRSLPINTGRGGRRGQSHPGPPSMDLLCHLKPKADIVYPPNAKPKHLLSLTFFVLVNNASIYLFSLLPQNPGGFRLFPLLIPCANCSPQSLVFSVLVSILSTIILALVAIFNPFDLHCCKNGNGSREQTGNIPAVCHLLHTSRSLSSQTNLGRRY